MGFSILYADFSCKNSEHKIATGNFIWKKSSPEAGVNVSRSKKQRHNKNKQYAAYLKAQSFRHH